MKSLKKKVLWSFVFLALVILTVYVLTNQSKSFSIKGFASFIAGANPIWLAGAIIAMLGFVFFEGMAVRTLCRMFGYRTGVRQSIVYSSSDIYFSAITPSASGGQPASALFMIGDGIPPTVTTIVLLINLTLYALSIILTGIICLLFGADILANFDDFSTFLILLGFVIQIFLVVLFLLLVYKEKIVMKIADAGIRVLMKLHLIKNGEKLRKRLIGAEEKYKECADAILDHKRDIFKAFIYNLLQRMSFILVSVCTYMAVYGNVSRIWDVFATQGYVVLGSNTIPIPGAVGVSDYLFMDGFHAIVKDPVNIELLSRGISFYSSVIICGIITLVAYIIRGVKGTKHKKNEE